MEQSKGQGDVYERELRPLIESLDATNRIGPFAMPDAPSQPKGAA